MAAAYSACRDPENAVTLPSLLAAPFLAFHVSGGTTDILYAEPDPAKIMAVAHIGGTLDLNAGQVIDRTGVKMGLPFPCGAAMDEMAIDYTVKVRRDKLSVRGYTCNLSGVENKAISDSFEEKMFHVIRAFHVAGRCTDCGECSRVCPQHIPLHLLNRKFIKDINELYGPYMAGSDLDTKPALLTYDTGDCEPSVVLTRGGEQA